MTQDELRQAAIEYLAKAFKSDQIPSPPTHLVQAAVSIILSPMPLTT